MRQSVGFDLASIGEVQFLRNVLEGLAARCPDVNIWIFHHGDTVAAFNELLPHLRQRVFHAPFRLLTWKKFRRLDLYITTEQFVPGPPGVYTLTLFHGQPSKGVTFELHGLDPLVLNDALFLYGPFHRQALDEHLTFWGRSLPLHLALFNIGYSKSDDLVGNRFSRTAILQSLELDTDRKTILYAPAFNEGASMRENAMEILQILCQQKEYNVLAKLAVDCLQPTSDHVATGGINWFETIAALERVHANFKLVRSIEADQALAAADVLVTCVSSISFEFLALGKPVVFVDTPKFYSKTLSTFFPGCDLSTWKDRTTVNAGREFGLLVSHPSELPSAISEVLTNPDRYPHRKSELRDYLLYNPGHASRSAVDKILELLAEGVLSQRPGDQGYSVLCRMCGSMLPLTFIRNKIARIGQMLYSPLSEKLKQIIIQVLGRHGYTLTKSALAFIDATSTVAAARHSGLSVCEYLESLEDDPRKRGRRDRIIEQLKAAGVFDGISTVCEIGAGSGRYLEKVIELARPGMYHVYETDQGWVDFLQSEYGNRNGCRLSCNDADGITLRQTDDQSCDLVHAHAVFVYLPLLQTMAYLEECVRVSRPGGYIVFDCFFDTSFSLSEAEAWLRGNHRFPVVIPNRLLDEFRCKHNIRLLKTFSMVYGDGSVDYMIWQKITK